VATAYDTVATVLTLAQACLNDQAGALFQVPAAGQSATPPGTINLIPHMNAAYRKVQRALANVGSDLFVDDDVLLVVAAVPANLQDPSYQVSITDSTPAPNQLPPNLLTPLKLWERVNGSTDNFVEMIDMTDHGGLPSQIQGPILEYWEWRDDALNFIGATQDTQIRVRFRGSLARLSDVSSPIQIRDAVEAIAYFTAAPVAASRGGVAAAKIWDDAGKEALEDLVSRETRPKQNSARRRRPYSWRAGYGPIV
jgi:hypothetical protein